jgi:uncharacterized protein YkwD
MTIRFFRGQRTRFEHEFAQIREISRLVTKAYPNEPVYILTNVLVANGEIDCILLTRRGPVILELKAYRGIVHGTENGPWTVDTKDGPLPLPNLFINTKIHRQDFIDRMIAISRKHFPRIVEANLKKIGSWVYFCKGSTYPEGQIDPRRVKWFRVVTAGSLIERMRFSDSGYTLEPGDMDAIVRDLRLEEYDPATDHPVGPATTARGKTVRRVAAAALVCLLIAAILVVPGIQGAVFGMVQQAIGITSGLIHSMTKEVIPSETSPEVSREAMAYLNMIRADRGLPPVLNDPRVYQLALVRAQDMARGDYLGYTNPATGSCANSLKDRFGFAADEYLTEDAFGRWNGYTKGIERAAIDSWMSDPGNRERLLSDYTSGAIACSGGYCSFLGTSQGMNITGCPPAIPL